ncbi:MAG TPA: DUF1501 domain-containing protein [Gemmataceae bacterium]|jgi:hypothetical protein
MLTIFGQKQRFCDGVSRRGFLRIGTFTFGAASLTLADILHAEARAAASGNRHKSVINIFLGGGPPHQDMWDIKTEAPAEIRGEFKPIATNVTGIQIGEVFPRIAARMDKCVVIRSVVGAKGGHDAFQCMSGWSQSDLRSMGGRPSIGAVAAKVQGPVDPSVPPFVGLAAPTKHIQWSDAGGPGFLGSSYAAFKPDGPGMADLTLRGTSVETLADRRSLLSSFDGLRADLDVSGTYKTVDALTERALGVLTSSKLVEALDLSKEDPKVRDRYGDGKPYNYQFDGAPTVNDQLLLARRLVEAGVRVVSLSYGRWDSHGKNFDLVRDHGSKLDQGFTALLDDLEARGLLDDVTVIAWGEFGRTPRINKGAGRDHWPQVSCALMAGGGMKTGQVIGATNRLGEHASNRPVTFGEIFATLYRNLGINPETTTIPDPTGRPQHVIDSPVLREVV